MIKWRIDGIEYCSALMVQTYQRLVQQQQEIIVHCNNKKSNRKNPK